MFLINSCQRYFRCGHFNKLKWQALFQSYGCFFAEFLEDLSLVRLGLLDLITCVGLRYGFYFINLRNFSWKRALHYSLGRTLRSLLYSDVTLTSASGFSWKPSSYHKHKSNNMQCIQHSVLSSNKIEVMEY